MKLLKVAKKIAKFTAIGVGSVSTAIVITAIAMGSQNKTAPLPTATPIATVKATSATPKAIPATPKATSATPKAIPATPKAIPATPKATVKTVAPKVNTVTSEDGKRYQVNTWCDAYNTFNTEYAIGFIPNNSNQSEVDQFCSNPKKDLYFINGEFTTLAKYDAYHSVR